MAWRGTYNYLITDHHTIIIRTHNKHPERRNLLSLSIK
jgi:hypothetical protein